MLESPSQVVGGRFQALMLQMRLVSSGRQAWIAAM